MEPIRIELHTKRRRTFGTWPYTFTFSDDGISITNGVKTAKAIWTDRDSDSYPEPKLSPDYTLEWQGYKELWHYNALYDIMSQEDYIYPPCNLNDMLEHIWREWKLDNITHEEVKIRMDEIKNYINSSTDGQPTDKFWADCM